MCRIAASAALDSERRSHHATNSLSVSNTPSSIEVVATRSQTAPIMVQWPTFVTFYMQMKSGQPVSSVV